MFCQYVTHDGSPQISLSDPIISWLADIYTFKLLANPYGQTHSMLRQYNSAQWRQFMSFRQIACLCNRLFEPKLKKTSTFAHSIFVRGIQGSSLDSFTRRHFIIYIYISRCFNVVTFVSMLHMVVCHRVYYPN